MGTADLAKWRSGGIHRQWQILGEIRMLQELHGSV